MHIQAVIKAGEDTFQIEASGLIPKEVAQEILEAIEALVEDEEEEDEPQPCTHYILPDPPWYPWYPGYPWYTYPWYSWTTTPIPYGSTSNNLTMLSTS